MIRIEFEKGVSNILNDMITRGEDISWKNASINVFFGELTYRVYASELLRYRITFKRIKSCTFDVILAQESYRYEDDNSIEKDLSPSEIEELLVRVVYKIKDISEKYHKKDEKRFRRSRRQRRKKVAEFVKSLLK